MNILILILPPYIDSLLTKSRYICFLVELIVISIHIAMQVHLIFTTTRSTLFTRRSRKHLKNALGALIECFLVGCNSLESNTLKKQFQIAYTHRSCLWIKKRTNISVLSGAYPLCTLAPMNALATIRRNDAYDFIVREIS